MLVVAAGLLVHTRLPDSAATDVAGDALYAAAVYFAIVIVLPRWRSAAVGAAAAAWCVAVELFQLTGLPERWAGEFPAVVLVLGTVFDARNLVVYVVTITVLAVCDGLVRRSRRDRASDASVPVD